MSKQVNAGQLKTPVSFTRLEKQTDEEGVTGVREVNVFGEGETVRCQWVNAHGSEVFTAMQLQLTEPATVTCRYSPRITRDLIVYKGTDPKPYEIVSIDNVEEQNRWMEIKVKRRGAAR